MDFFMTLIHVQCAHMHKAMVKLLFFTHIGMHEGFLPKWQIWDLTSIFVTFDPYFVKLLRQTATPSLTVNFTFPTLHRNSTTSVNQFPQPKPSASSKVNPFIMKTKLPNNATTKSTPSNKSTIATRQVKYFHDITNHQLLPTEMKYIQHKAIKYQPLNHQQVITQ